MTRFLAGLALLAISEVRAKPSSPHIVFMLADDLGYGIPGWGGNPTQQTPALDALRADGLTLTENHVYQFCSPSRGALMTGRYPWKLPQSIYNCEKTTPRVAALASWSSGLRFFCSFTSNVLRRHAH